MGNYRISNAAEADIEHVYVEGAKTFGFQQAEAYHSKLEHIFRLIADNPYIAREREEIFSPVRVHPCGSHVIIYEIDFDGVFILRVRHHLEDWINHFAE